MLTRFAVVKKNYTPPSTNMAAMSNSLSSHLVFILSDRQVEALSVLASREMEDGTNSNYSKNWGMLWYDAVQLFPVKYSEWFVLKDPSKSLPNTYWHVPSHPPLLSLPQNMCVCVFVLRLWVTVVRTYI
jgi:hypothetical protein